MNGEWHGEAGKCLPGRKAGKDSTKSLLILSIVLLRLGERKKILEKNLFRSRISKS